MKEKMSTKNIIKFITLLLSVLVFGVSLISTAFAQVEVPPSVDIYKNYEGWYKNFIVECGACRITVRNYDGSTLYDYVVYPKQFEDKSEIIRKLNYRGVDNQKDSEGRTIFFMQKNEGKLNLNDYDYKGLEKKYSDNIPQLPNFYNSNKKELSYIYFEDFSEYKTVDDWKNHNNGENVNKLATDLGIDVASLCKNPVDGKELNFYEWVITPNAEGISPSLEVQPITLYPESTEQIYCNDFYTAAEFGMQWNSDLIAYCTELSNGIFDTIGRFFDGVFAMLFGAKKIGIGDLITFYSGKLIYYQIMGTELFIYFS